MASLMKKIFVETKQSEPSTNSLENKKRTLKSPTTPRSPKPKRRHSLLISQCDTEEPELDPKPPQTVLLTYRKTKSMPSFFGSIGDGFRDSSEDVDEMIKELNPQKEIPNATYEGYSINFLSVFTHKDMKLAFKSHLEEEYALNNFEFIETVNDFPDDKEENTIESFYQIFNFYVISEHERSLNMSGRKIEKICSRIDLKNNTWTIEETPKEILTILKNIIMTDLYEDSFQRFLRKQTTYDLICENLKNVDVISKKPEYCVLFKLIKSFYGSELNDRELLTISMRLSNDDLLKQFYLNEEVLKINEDNEVLLIMIEKKRPIRPIKKIKQYLSPLVLEWFEPEFYQSCISISDVLLNFDEDGLCIPRKNCTNEAVFVVKLGSVKITDESLKKVLDCIVIWNTTKKYSTKSGDNLSSSKKFSENLIEHLGITLSNDSSKLLTSFFLNHKKFVPTEKFKKSYQMKEKFRLFDSHESLDEFINKLKEIDSKFENFTDDINYLKSLDQAFWMRYFSMLQESNRDLKEQEYMKLKLSKICPFSNEIEIKTSNELVEIIPSESTIPEIIIKL
eukprot:gene7083-11246_t